MAPDEAELGTEEKQDSKLPLILGLLLVLVLGAGGGYLASKTLGAEDEETSEETEGASVEGSPSTDATVVSLGQFTVNLRDSAGGRVLQMEIQVRGNQEVATIVDERLPQIRDAVLLLTSDYTYMELEGVDGKMRLRDELHTRINAVLKPQKVNAVYFTAFVVQ